MVRNIASMQSLRESMADVSISPEQNEQRAGAAAMPTLSQGSFAPAIPYEHRPPMPPMAAEHENPPLERLDRRSLQLCGNDAYTKSLMNRIATGQATEPEKIAFNDYIQRAANMPTNANAPSSALVSQQHPKTLPPPPPPFTSYFPPAPPRVSMLAPMPERVPGYQPPLPRSTFLAQHKPVTQARPIESGDQGMKSKRVSYPHSANTAHPTEHTSKAHSFKQATRINAEKYTKPFCDFLTENPTVFHAVAAMKKQLLDAGFTELSEREKWSLTPSGSYFVERNGSSLIAFTVGGQYKPGNGAAILAGHVDALTAKLKPISQVPNKAGFLQLGVAPYAGGMNSTWWDRDLGIAGRVLLKQGDKIVTKLVKLDWPIARIPTLAPHFGAAANGPFNLETQMVPIIGLGGTETSTGLFEDADRFSQPPLLGGATGPVRSFVNTQPPGLVSAISDALGIKMGDSNVIVNWELELFDTQPAAVGGLNKEFIFAGRIDDKLCSWAALQALIESKDAATDDSSVIKMAALFDDEEIGSLLRQGARGNFLPATIERAVGSLARKPGPNLIGRTYANSFLVSSDVTHAVNPNFLNAYLENHAPHLNVGVAVSADPNGHMTTDAISTAILKRCADKVGAQLQVFQIRNDSRSGGTVGPMLSSMTGMRAIDAGIPQLSMHSIRATTGALDPGLGVILFSGFLNGFEEVDLEFQS